MRGTVCLPGTPQTTLLKQHSTAERHIYLYHGRLCLFQSPTVFDSSAPKYTCTTASFSYSVYYHSSIAPDHGSEVHPHHSNRHSPNLHSATVSNCHNATMPQCCTSALVHCHSTIVPSAPELKFHRITFSMHTEKGKS